MLTTNPIFRLRAELLTKIRAFFAERNVLEVETPLLSASTNPAPHLQSFTTTLELQGAPKIYYLQTSPEFAMKRLLAAGSGDIYQICKAFRNQEIGSLHNPEFTILEWYRIGFDHHALMDEMDELLKNLINAPKAKRFTYSEIFSNYLQLDPFASELSQLKLCAKNRGFVSIETSAEKSVWLELLFTNFIEPQLGKENPVFIYDFPKDQAMLARINQDNKTAARFEVYYQGVELANGFYELNAAKEQRERFLHDLEKRKELQLPTIPLDENFLAALAKLPDCAGVALGIDRLLLLASGKTSIKEVLSFPIECA
ncbi:MAG: EF-P lysine aminoacylase EpmA [Gammaproteobacteria bacterium]|nr:EF-P lysine aminoacylase EpmA [Gammaproteobacteria bacterium]